MKVGFVGLGDDHSTCGLTWEVQVPKLSALTSLGKHGVVRTGFCADLCKGESVF